MLVDAHVHLNDDHEGSPVPVEESCRRWFAIHDADTDRPPARVRQAHPLLVDDVAVDDPDVDDVTCHLGDPWLRDTAEVLDKNDNVYADVCWLVLAEEDEAFGPRIVEEVGEAISDLDHPSKLLYGSDRPLRAMGPCVSFLEELELDPAAREALAWRTAAEIFDLPPGTAA